MLYNTKYRRKIRCNLFTININATEYLRQPETNTLFRTPLNMMINDPSLVWPEAIVPYNFAHGIRKQQIGYYMHNVCVCSITIRKLNRWFAVILNFSIL